MLLWSQTLLLSLFYLSTGCIFPTGGEKHDGCLSCPAPRTQGESSRWDSPPRWWHVHEWRGMVTYARVMGNCFVCTSNGEQLCLLGFSALENSGALLGGLCAASGWKKKGTVHAASPKFTLPSDVAITRKSKGVLCANFWACQTKMHGSALWKYLFQLTVEKI